MNSAADFIRRDVHCHTCGRDSKIPLDELSGSDFVKCRYCGEDINVRTEEWQKRIAEALKVYGKIKPLNQL